MAFGRGRKNKGDAPEAVETTVEAQSAPADAKRSGQKKRKPQELLSSVVNETAVGAAIDVMKRNDAFALPNGASWVGLLLSADAIGGLNQKQKSDAAKGSIIELIAADKIQVVATKAMLDEEFLGLIPTAETLERMEEYRLLTDAPYYWVVFRTEDGGHSLIADAVHDTPATYADAVAVSRGTETIQSLLPAVWQWSGGTVESAAESDFERVLVGAAASGASVSTTGAAPADTDPLGDAFSFDDDDEVDYSSLAADGSLDLDSGEVTDGEPALEFDAARFEAEFAGPETTFPDADDEEPEFDTTWQTDDPDEGQTAAGETGDEDNSYFQYLAENRNRVVDEDEVRDTIARRFLSDDLNLVVDLAEFERVFNTDTEGIALEIADDPSDWLGSQVAQLSRQANAELRALHQGHVDELRQLYVETAALHVERTMAAVSTSTPGSQYAELMEGAKRDFESQRTNAQQEIAEQRREITARFEAAAQSRAEQAAAHARAVYEDKNRPKLERDLAEVGQEVDRRHEEQYSHNRQTVLEMRRKDANVRIDVGNNRIFELLRERQAEQREGERALLERWNHQLIQFIDENRKDDIARSIALAEQLDRTNKVDELEEKHREELERLRREHAEREDTLRAEQVRIREEALAELQSRQAAWDSAATIEQERATASSGLIDQLREQVGSLREQYDAEYKARITSLEEDKKASAEALDRAHGLQKRATFILVALALVLAIASIAIGVILGWSWGHNQAVQTVPAGFAALGSLLP
jgi:hypothetical protein